jgi:hypothetical protein
LLISGQQIVTHLIEQENHMKKIIVHALVLFLIGTAAFADAGPRYFFNTGMSKPFSPTDFRNQWRSGFNLGAGVGFQLAPKIEIEAEFLVHQMQLDDNAYLSNVTSSDDLYSAVTGGTTTIVDLSANFKYLVPSPSDNQITPYLLGVVGIADQITSKKDVTTQDLNYTEARESTVAPMAGLGLGFEIALSDNTSLVIEGSFHFLFAQETTIYFPFKFGIVLN